MFVKEERVLEVMREKHSGYEDLKQKTDVSRRPPTG